MKNTSQAAAPLAVSLAAFGFSWGFIIVKGVQLPPTTIAFFRTWIGATVLLSVAALRGMSLPRTWGPIVGAGVLFGLHQLLFISAAQQTSIAIATLVQGAQPLVVALVSRRLLREPVSRGLLMSSALAIAGVALVVFANRHDDSHSLLGDLYAVANLFAFVGYFLFTKRARAEGVDTLPLTGWAFAVAGVMVTPVYLAGADGSLPENWQFGLVALMALLPGNGHLLVNWAHPRISAALASLLLSLVPVLSSLWAFLIFDEPYGVQHVLGTLLTLGAIELGRRAEQARAS